MTKDLIVLRDSSYGGNGFECKDLLSYLNRVTLVSKKTLSSVCARQAIVRCSPTFVHAAKVGQFLNKLLIVALNQFDLSEIFLAIAKYMLHFSLKNVDYVFP